MNNAVQEIKDRLKIEDIVGQYAQLKKAGRSFKALCPFHNENTPSFVVSPDRQIAYCFGCNKGGDVFTFVQEMEGLDFVDTLKMLAEKAGVELEEYKPKGNKPRVTKNEKDQFFQVYDDATNFYEKQLWETEDGKKVLDYLKRRGLTEKSIKSFRIGFAPDSFDDLYPRLLKKDYTKKFLVASGLALTKETTVDKIYDRFRGRLMFPIRDNLGRIVAFGGRALKKDQNPKYLNSPESPIYHKSTVLYGFYQAKSELKQKGRALIAEGYFDVIAAHQVGAINTVAPCGTALATRQLRLLKPFVSEIVLAFDNDFAGQEAAQRAYEMAQEFEFGVKMLLIDDGKDPADYVRDHGEDFLQLIHQAKDYGDYFYEELFRKYGTDSVAAKKKILQEFLPFFAQMKSSIEKDEYVRRLALDLDVKEVQIYDEVKSYTLPANHPARLKEVLDDRMTAKSSTRKRAEEILLGLAIEFPRIGKLFLKTIAEDEFPEDLKAIYKALADLYNDDGLETTTGVIDYFPHEIKENAALLSLYVSEHYGEISEVDVENELNALLLRLRQKRRDTRRLDLQKRLQQAEKDEDRDLSQQLLQELNELNTETLR